MRRNVGVLVVAVVLAVLLGSVAQALPPRTGQARSLASSLDVAAYRHELTDDIAMTLTLTNVGIDSVSVLRWLTPIDGITADIFEVQRDGERVPYVGRVYKRAEPGPGDVLHLEPGQSVSATFDLSSAYDMSVKGEYTVRYRGLPTVADEVADDEDAPSNAVRLWVEGYDTPPTYEAPEQAIGGYTGCTNTQQGSLSTALTNAGTMSTKAYNYLVSNGNSTLYRYWFGAYTSSRLTTVKSHYSALKSTFSGKTFTFDCTCTDSAYAYVYPTKPYKVYLCKAFWSAPSTGRDSKAGTLVHETSHFNVVAGTQDYVYGATGAHNLALSSPTKAINNADNHEYFAEDQK